MSLTADELQDLFVSFEKSAFRLQLLPEYRVEAEREELASYLAGEPMPDRSGNPWLATMANQVAQGRAWTNVHLLPERLTPYLRYLIDWWYVFQHQAGAQILFLPPECASKILPLSPNDFWLFDDRLLVPMRYGSNGRFLGAEATSTPVALAKAQQARDFALGHAEDLREILARRRAGSLV